MKTFILVLFAFTITTHAREVSLSFDDCPRKTDKLFTGMERAKKLVEELKKADVKQVAFFCNSPFKAKDGTERLKYFADAGHIIANHSLNHDDLNTTDTELYNKRIGLAHEELKDFPNFRKWYRFPFLREGKTPEKVDGVRKYLAKHGYKNAYVTIDNGDWYMDHLFVKAVNAGKKFDKEKLCATYKGMMADEADFYDNMSVKALGRSVKHVFLLHETDLNALCIGDLVAELRARKWTIITPEESYTDPIALREPSNKVPLNQGRVHALAKERGYKGPYYSKWNEEEEIDREFEVQKVWQ